MTFKRSDLAFEAGLFANRSRRASRFRWTDGNLVRFRDGLPGSIGGWEGIEPGGDPVTGKARAIIAWRPNDQNGRFSAIGSNTGAFLYDLDNVDDITPAGFTPGSEDSVIGVGFGAGSYGEGTYGTPRITSNNIIDAANWTFDMFGEILLACYTVTGQIYDFELGTDAQLQVVPDTPTARAILVSDERHAFAFGADGIPGNVRWSEREDYTVWDDLPTNRAGGYELQVRSPFQCGARVRGAVLGWTKTEVFAFRPLQNALVYDRERISTEAGVVGPHAVTVVTDNLGEAAYWMGRSNFYAYDGLVRALDCDLRDYVFNDLNALQSSKVFAGLNAAFNEVWFFYPSANSDEIDRAVVYNYADGSWTKALVARTCWLDSGVYNNPLGVAPDASFFFHEIGTTADGADLGSYVISHPIQIGSGEAFADVDQFWPDLQDGSGTCKVSFLCRNWPGAPSEEVGPFEFEQADEKIDLAFSTREFQLKVAGVAGSWELGLPQISIQGGSLR